MIIRNILFKIIEDTIELINVDHSIPSSYIPIMIQAAGVVVRV